jgi:hypothetical protein
LLFRCRKRQRLTPEIAAFQQLHFATLPHFPPTHHLAYSSRLRQPTSWGASIQELSGKAHPPLHRHCSLQFMRARKMAPSASHQLASGQYLNNMTTMSPVVPASRPSTFCHALLASDRRNLDFVVVHRSTEYQVIIPWKPFCSPCRFFSLRSAYAFDHASSERSQCQLPHCHY